MMIGASRGVDAPLYWGASALVAKSHCFQSDCSQLLLLFFFSSRPNRPILRQWGDIFNASLQLIERERREEEEEEEEERKKDAPRGHALAFMRLGRPVCESS